MTLNAKKMVNLLIKNDLGLLKFDAAVYNSDNRMKKDEDARRMSHEKSRSYEVRSRVLFAI